ncbi:MAG: type II toxin-antitoxin system HicA family toxin, partial [Bryobacteraceae bacterium]
MRFLLGRLRVLSGDEICRVLERSGFVAIRQRGSHRIMQKRTESTTVTIPVPLHNPVKRGTL